MSDRELGIRCELAEAEGWYSLMTEIDSEAKSALGISSTRVAGAPAWAVESISMILFNRTIGLGLYEPCISASLDEIAAFYGEGLHGIEISPFASSLDLEDLAARGYRPGPRRPKFVRSSEPLALPDGVSVRLAEPADAELYADVMAAAFGFPDVVKVLVASILRSQATGRSALLAYESGRAVGTGVLFVSGGIGWLGGGGCLPEFRGRGVQRALIEGRAAAARDLGAQWVTAETDADTHDAPGYSFRNMMRSGFLHAFDRSIYLKG